MSNTEANQIDRLIQQLKDEIDDLEKRKSALGDEDNAEATSPAKVAQDPNASDGDRVAAANAVLGQDPVKVNSEQSAPSPSTHAEQFVPDAPEEEKTEEPEADSESTDDTDTDKDQVSEVKDEETESQDQSKDKKASTKKS